MTKSKVLKRIFAFVMITTMLLAMSATAFAYNADDNGTYQALPTAATRVPVTNVVETGFKNESIGYRTVVVVDGKTGNLSWSLMFDEFLKSDIGTTAGVNDGKGNVTFTLAKFAALTKDSNNGNQSNAAGYSYTPSADSAELRKVLDGYVAYLKSVNNDWVKTTGDDGKITDAAEAAYYVFYGAGTTNQRVYQTTVLNSLPRVLTDKDTTDPDMIGKNAAPTTVTIKMKSSLPQPTKTVSKTEVNVGDVVTYDITATVPTYPTFAADDNGNNNPVLYMQDTLSSGLTLTTAAADFKVYAVVGGADVELKTGQANHKDNGYSVTMTDNGFKIYFNYDNANVSGATLLKTSYTAVINESAVVGSAGNPNKYDLVYSNDPKTEDVWNNPTKPTATQTVIKKVWTNALKVTKVDATSKATLSGAEFEVYTGYDAATKAYSGYLGTFKVGTDGIGYFNGVANTKGGEKCWLKETVAPAGGYNPPQEPFEVKVIPTLTETVTTTIKYTSESTKANIQPAVQAINDEGKKLYLKADNTTTTNSAEGVPAYVESVTYTKTAEGGTGVAGNTAYLEIEIPNDKLNEFPATGGIGTTLFYVLGGLMVVGAGIVLITKKRMANSEN